MTEVQLPAGWSRRTLSEVANITMGQSPPGSAYNDQGLGLPFFQGKAEFGPVHPTVKKWTTEGNKRAYSGDILMSVRAPVGPTNIADTECVIGRGLAAIRAREQMNQTFLLWFLRGVEGDIASRGTGTTFDSISGDSLRKQLVYAPPLPEQNEIVRILEEQFSRLDAAVASIAAVRRKADQFRRSLLHAAFSGALTGSSSSWPTEQLGSVCKVVSGATPKTSISAYWEGDIPWLTPNDLSKNRSKVVSAGERAITKAGFDSCSTQIVPAGTVLFTSRAPIGYVAIAGAPLCTNQGFKSAIPNDTLLSDFLFWQLQALTEDIRSRASGTTFLEISAKGFSATQVVVPSLEVQRQVVDVIESQIDRYEGIIHAVKTLDNRIAAMRRSLLHAAFSGELTKEWRNRNYG